MEETYPPIYEKHYQALWFANSILTIIARALGDDRMLLSYPEAGLSALALALRRSSAWESIPEDEMQWIDSEMDHVLRALLPVVRDDDFPGNCEDVRLAVESAFES